MKPFFRHCLTFYISRTVGGRLHSRGMAQVRPIWNYFLRMSTTTRANKLRSTKVVAVVAAYTSCYYPLLSLYRLNMIARVVSLPPRRTGL